MLLQLTYICQKKFTSLVTKQRPPLLANVIVMWYKFLWEWKENEIVLSTKTVTNVMLVFGVFLRGGNQFLKVSFWKFVFELWFPRLSVSSVCRWRASSSSVSRRSADERFDASFHTNILVNSSGYCQYLPPGTTPTRPPPGPHYYYYYCQLVCLFLTHLPT